MQKADFDKIKIIILAAGKGKRMQSEEPKALAKLKGKPFLLHILDTLKKLEESIQPIIVVGYKKERIQEVLGTEYVYAEQHEQLGTGHAVWSAKNAINSLPKIIFVISADQPLVSEKTIKNIISKHQEKNATITVGTVVVPDFEDWRMGLNHFGRIIHGTDNLVRKIVELKDTSDEEKKIKELNLGLYAFDANWLWNNIDKLKNDNAQREYLLTDMIKLAFEQNKTIATARVENLLEAIHPNSKEELEILEKLVS